MLDFKTAFEILFLIVGGTVFWGLKLKEKKMAKRKRKIETEAKIKNGEFPQKKIEILSYIEGSYQKTGLFGGISATPFSTTTFDPKTKMYLAEVVDKNKQVKFIKFQAIEKIVEYGKDIQLSFYKGDGQRYQPEILIPRSKIKERYY